MATPKKFYIKERHNPQTGVYYVACGQMSKQQAKSYEKALYGANVMLPFDTESEYNAKLDELRAKGERIH